MGTGSAPQQLIVALPLLLLLLLLFSRTDIGLCKFWCGLKMSSPVSTAGKASLFDNHSSSSSANSWLRAQMTQSQLVINTQSKNELTQSLVKLLTTAPVGPHMLTSFNMFHVTLLTKRHNKVKFKNIKKIKKISTIK